MINRRFIILVAVFGFSFFISSFSVAKDMNPKNMITTEVDGESISHYTVLWWNWFYSILPGPEHPLLDKTGERCAVNQSGKVWYLLAGPPNGEKVRRTCSVPSDKYILIPLLNKGGWLRKGGCKAVIRAYGLDDASVKTMEVYIDGKQVDAPKQYHYKSPGCFRMRGNLVSASKYGEFPAASDGYWIMLKPMSKGKHTISFKSSYEIKGQEPELDQLVSYDVFYTLIIK